MITKDEIKNYSKLLQKKYRAEEKKFIAEGEKIFEEALSAGLRNELVLVTNSFAVKNESLLNQIRKQNLKVEIIKQPDFNKLSDTQTPQGIAGIFYIKNRSFEELEKKHPHVIIALERISDPGNLGTIVRNCDWFGFNYLITGKDCAEIYNPKVIRASMGSVFHINIFEGIDLYKKTAELVDKGYEAVVSDLAGTAIGDFKPSKKTLLFFCNESSGPSYELLQIAGRKITIPRYGRAESLNVSTASSIILNGLREKISKQ